MINKINWKNSDKLFNNKILGIKHSESEVRYNYKITEYNSLKVDKFVISNYKNGLKKILNIVKLKYFYALKKLILCIKDSNKTVYFLHYLFNSKLLNYDKLLFKNIKISVNSNNIRKGYLYNKKMSCGNNELIKTKKYENKLCNNIYSSKKSYDPSAFLSTLIQKNKNTSNIEYDYINNNISNKLNPESAVNYTNDSLFKNIRQIQFKKILNVINKSDNKAIFSNNNIIKVLETEKIITTLVRIVNNKVYHNIYIGFLHIKLYIKFLNNNKKYTSFLVLSKLFNANTRLFNGFINIKQYGFSIKIIKFIKIFENITLKRYNTAFNIIIKRNNLIKKLNIKLGNKENNIIRLNSNLKNIILTNNNKNTIEAYTIYLTIRKILLKKYFTIIIKNSNSRYIYYLKIKNLCSNIKTVLNKNKIQTNNVYNSINNNKLIIKKLISLLNSYHMLTKKIIIKDIIFSLKTLSTDNTIYLRNKLFKTNILLIEHILDNNKTKEKYFTFNKIKQNSGNNKLYLFINKFYDNNLKRIILLIYKYSLNKNNKYNKNKINAIHLKSLFDRYSKHRLNSAFNKIKNNNNNRNKIKITRFNKLVSNYFDKKKRGYFGILIDSYYDIINKKLKIFKNLNKKISDLLTISFNILKNNNIILNHDIILKSKLIQLKYSNKIVSYKERSISKNKKSSNNRTISKKNNPYKNLNLKSNNVNNNNNNNSIILNDIESKYTEKNSYFKNKIQFYKLNKKKSEHNDYYDVFNKLNNNDNYMFDLKYSNKNIEFNTVNKKKSNDVNFFKIISTTNNLKETKNKSLTKLNFKYNYRCKHSNADKIKSENKFI